MMNAAISPVKPPIPVIFCSMASGSSFFDRDPALPFKYIGGDPSLDLANTVDLTDAGPVDERLVTYDGLTRWAQGAGVLSAEDGARLRARAASRPEEASAALASALRLRAVLQRLFAEVAAGALSDASLDEFNAAHTAALSRLVLRRREEGAEGLAWGWRGWGEALDCLLWPVIWSAARLLASDERARIHVCAGPRCSWAYVDRSRNGLRRWCQTDVCGAQAKARRHHARKRAARIQRG